MKTSIIALAAVLRQQDELSAAAAGDSPEKTYARAAAGDNRPSTPEETAHLTAAENAIAAEETALENPLFGTKRLSEMTGPEMLALQHEMVATAVDLGMASSEIVPRKVWRNKADGVRTCLALHKCIVEVRGTQKAPAPLSPGLRRLRGSAGAEEMRQNTLAEGNAALARAASDRQTSEGGVAKETEMQTAASEAPKRRGKKKAASGGTKRKAAGRKTERKARATAPATAAPSRVGVPGVKVLGARTEGLMEGTIHVLVEGNPKREGTKQHDFWKYYRDGMKVKTFVAKFSEDDGGRTEAMNRLLFDQKRALIKVEL